MTCIFTIPSFVGKRKLSSTCACKNRFVVSLYMFAAICITLASYYTRFAIWKLSSISLAPLQVPQLTLSIVNRQTHASQVPAKTMEYAKFAITNLLAIASMVLQEDNAK